MDAVTVHDSVDMIMQRRNSPMIRVVVVVAALGAILYLVYLNHDVNTRLKNTDDRAEKYRRSHESLSAQLQVMFDHKSRLEKSLQQEKIDHKKTVDDLNAAKDEAEKKFHSDRDEMASRFNAKHKESKMIKSQHDDLKVDYEKLRDEINKLQSDLANLKSEDNREYQEMKTQKDFEISSMKDTIANTKKETERVRSDLQACLTQNQHIQAERDYALSNISRIQQESNLLKTQSQADQTTIANLQMQNQNLQVLTNASQSTITRLEVTNKDLQAAHEQSQQIMTALRLENQQLKNAQQNLHLQQQQQQQQPGQAAANQPLFFQGQRNLIGQIQQLQQQQQQQQPVGGAALAQNNPAGGAVAGQEQAGGQGLNPIGAGVNPQVPQVNDQNFQIQPAGNLGERPAGYQHNEGGADGGVGAGADVNLPQHKEEEEVHQVQPPNLHRIDDDGLNHVNKQDHGHQDLDVKLHKKIGFEDNNSQLGHDNSIHNQGPVHLQVQEPFINHPEVKRDAHGAIIDEAEAKWRQANLQEEEEEDGDQDEGQIEQPKLNHFMQNAHPNKNMQVRQPVNRDQNQLDQDDGQRDNDNYYEEDEDNDDADEGDEDEEPVHDNNNNMNNHHFVPQ